MAVQPTDPLERLLALLELEELGGDRFRGANPPNEVERRVFGGQVASQALRAAMSTVDVDHRVHSLHAFFLRPGELGVPIDYDVDRIRDGRSFTTRRVVARQGDQGAILSLSASFHRAESGVDYQQPVASDVPHPDDTSDELTFIPRAIRDRLPVELRELGSVGPDPHGWYPSTRRVWVRTRGRLPDDPAVHACALTFLSDMGAVLGARAPLAEQPLERIQGASLDHAVWFHRPVRADEWLLYDLRAISNAGARGLTHGTIHTLGGVLGASVAQEALLRVAGDPPTGDPPTS